MCGEKMINKYSILFYSINNVHFTIIRSNICKTDLFMSLTGAKKHKLYSLYHNLFKLLCNWPLEIIYKSRFIKKAKSILLGVMHSGPKRDLQVS